MTPHPRYKATLNQLKRLHPCAEVLGQVSGMMRESKQEIESIAAILRTDASLSSDIIRMSNSSYYGYATQVANLDEALQRIGLREAQKLINLSLARSVYSKPLRHYQLTANHFWARGVSCALLMEKMAKQLNLPCGDAYTAGTLHTAGKVVIEQILTQSGNRNIWDRQTPDYVWEQEQVGVHYAQAGCDLVRLWRIPESVADAIADHIEPTENSSALARIQHIAVSLISECSVELEREPKNIPAHAHEMGFEMEALSDYVSQSRNTLNDLKEALNMG